MSKIFEALQRTEHAIKPLAEHGDNGHDAALSRAPAEPAATAADARTKETTGPFNVQIVPIQLVAGSPIMPFDGTDPRASAQYRIIRTKIHNDPKQPRILMVSSPMPGDGKTINAINLAAALALQERVRVLLIDADFSRPSVAKLLGLRSSPGLGDVLHGTAAINDALIRVEQFSNLYVLTVGKTTSNPAELLASGRWEALCELFRNQFRYTVLDVPPVGTIADYELLQLSTDGVVLVVRPDHTNRQLCEMAFQTVPKAKQIGVIVNCAEEWFLSKTHSYYYYASGDRL